MLGKYSPTLANANRDPLDNLVRRIARGERSALAGLHDTLASEVLAAIRRQLPDAAGAMSVLRATFVEVWRLARHHVGEGAVRVWVTGIADRRAVEHVRASQNRVEQCADLSDIVASHWAHNDREFGRLLALRDVSARSAGH